MATQAVMIAETITGMKKAVKRKAYDSDSDSSIEQLTNRGNKLRKKARFVHEGQLAPPTGPQIYRRNIEHAGFHRAIISRNPPLVDEDGYVVDSDDDDERSRLAIAAAAEFDPYANVRLEHLLAPLTSAADLPDHPTLAKPFTSKTLTELTRHAGEMLQKERAALWRIKHLLTRLSGDSTWIPCESVETDNDIALFSDDWERGYQEQLGKSRFKGENGPKTMEVDSATVAARLIAAAPLADTGTQSDTGPAKVKTDGPTISQVDHTAGVDLQRGRLDSAEQGSAGTTTMDQKVAAVDQSISSQTGIVVHSNKPPSSKFDQVDAEHEQSSATLAVVDNGMDDAEDLPVPRRMRTRAQAQAASDNTATSRDRSMSPDPNTVSFIHPYFLAPQLSHPDRDLGLPLHEAEETRRLLQLYIQKQEEVCRGAQRVYEGLLKADRHRHLVMKWAKAEAHVGVNRDMSDGEDWYDKEEWGLEGNLKKGQDEEEEDAATTAKKTRTRRQ